MTPVTPMNVGTSQRRRCESSASPNAITKPAATETATSSRCSSVGVT